MEVPLKITFVKYIPFFWLGRVSLAVKGQRCFVQRFPLFPELDPFVLPLSSPIYAMNPVVVTALYTSALFVLMF